MPKSKSEWLKAIFRTLIVILGTALVAFGSVAFHVPLNINAGGLSGVGIIVRYFAPDNMKVIAYNLVITIASVILWGVGLIFIGKEFSIKTLVATIAFPAFNWLFTACPGISGLVSDLGGLMKAAANGPTAGNYLLAGVFGGVFVGAGVSITFIGGGSTGGVDVLTFIMEKYLRIKQSTASFMIDGTIVATGLCILLPIQNEFLLPCLCGVVSAFVTAGVIEFIYIKSQTSYQVDVISDRWEEISQTVQNEIGRGTTVIPAKGGYKGAERVILRIVFDRWQYNRIRNIISKIDSKAFVTFTRTNAVYGEGFKPYTTDNIFTKKKKNGK